MANIGSYSNVPNEVEPQGNFEVIPAGEYRVQVVQSDMKPTKNGDGQYLWLELDILDGDYANRKIFDRINLENANSQTVEIAKRVFSALCHATGVIGAQDSEELHYKPCIAVVQVRPAKGEYGPSNQIRTYKPVDVATANIPQGARSTPAAKPAAGEKVPAWRQRRTAA